MRARSYRPDLGRFLGRDRFESAQGDLRLQSDPLMQNRYVFASANPVDNVEFDGHEPISTYNPKGRQKMRDRRGRCMRDCDAGNWPTGSAPPARRGAGGSNTYAPWRRQGSGRHATFRRESRPMHIGPGGRVGYPPPCPQCAGIDDPGPRGMFKGDLGFVGDAIAGFTCEFTAELVCFGDQKSAGAKLGRGLAIVNPKGLVQKILKEGGERAMKKFADDAEDVGSQGRRVGTTISTPKDVLANPSLLSGKRPSDVEDVLSRAPGWRVETLGRGTHRGQGWVLREYTERGNPTGSMIRWHPGGGRHGPEPYWRVIDNRTGRKSGEIR